MKKYITLLLMTALCTQVDAQLGNIIRHAKDKASDKANNAVDKTVDGNGKTKTTTNGSNTSDNTGTTAADNNNNAPSTGPATLKTYQNYDFVPGDTILFEENFTEDQDGEFPSHWDLLDGQAAVNKVAGVPALAITEGNYARVAPLMKTGSYLTDPFTVECDYFVNDGGAYGINIFFEAGKDKEGIINYNEHGSVSSSYFEKNFSADFPDKNAQDDDFYKKWHHIAIIYKNRQMKCYLDQYRVLVMPNVDIIPTSIEIGGIGGQDEPIVFTNLKVASGGQMNMIGQKFTESKIVTHGITFDIDQSTIKPESMGTLNMIAQVMKNNPDVKFEIDGHTDNTGDAAHNLSLSQQRADAVKTQLVAMGIDGSRLTTKGFGDTKPIADNSSQEGRANNRRVEFVKQ